MPSNRLTVLLDRTLRHSRSASNLSQVTSDDHSSLSTSSRRTDSKEHLSILVDYKFDRSSSQPRQPSSPPAPAPLPKDDAPGPRRRPIATPRPPTTARPVSPCRANTTPVMHPPDELFLKVIRRRSANARLEQQRISIQRRSTFADNDIAMSVAIASALPPQYFDLPPEYESPQRASMFPHARGKGTVKKLRDHELFLDPLRLQIDQAIADFGGFHVTESTPVQSTPSEYENGLVSPINEVDNIYLERRRQMKREQRQQEHYHRNTT